MLPVRVSNWGQRLPWFMPRPVQLPPCEPKLIVFDFPNLAALGVGKQAIGFSTDTLIWAVTAVATGAPAAFCAQVYHDHKHGQRRWYNTHQLGSNVFGTAQQPTLMKSTQLVEAGDTLTMELKSLDAAAQSFQVVLWCGEVL
jgi:hypothetical protein